MLDNLEIEFFFNGWFRLIRIFTVRRTWKRLIVVSVDFRGVGRSCLRNLGRRRSGLFDWGVKTEADFYGWRAALRLNIHVEMSYDGKMSVIEWLWWWSTKVLSSVSIRGVEKWWIERIYANFLSDFFRKKSETFSFLRWILIRFASFSLFFVRFDYLISFSVNSTIKHYGVRLLNWKYCSRWDVLGPWNLFGFRSKGVIIVFRFTFFFVFSSPVPFE